MDEFVSSVSEAEYDFIALSDTWLSPDVLDTEYFPANYSVIRCDRDCVAIGVLRGCGVLLVYRCDFRVEILDLSDLRTALITCDILDCKFTFKSYVY